MNCGSFVSAVTREICSLSDFLRWRPARSPCSGVVRKGIAGPRLRRQVPRQRLVETSNPRLGVELPAATGFASRNYNPPMFFSKDRRRRAVLLLSLGVVLFFALLGALQWFNTSGVSFLNPETSGETLAFTALTVVLFLLLIVLLLLLLRNILKLYADQGSSALGARLRTRMVLGAALIALTPAVLMFLFSFQLMNRSIDRWVSSQHVGTARRLDPRGAGVGRVSGRQRPGSSRVNRGIGCSDGMWLY